MALILCCSGNALANLVLVRAASRNKDYEWSRLYILLANLWCIAGTLIAALRITQ